MGITHKHTGIDPAKMLAKIAEEYGDAYVSVGVHTNENGDYEGTNVTTAQVALWNEFGTTRPGAKYPTPERSFLRSTEREQRAGTTKLQATLLAECLTGKMNPEKALKTLGTRLMFAVQNKIKSNIAPPNAPWTLRRKKELKQGTTTLIATGQLLRSIKFEVHTGKPPE
jgi:hypothetical protein